jgi:hypothetical protein
MPVRPSRSRPAQSPSPRPRPPGRADPYPAWLRLLAGRAGTAVRAPVVAAATPARA